MKKITSLLGLIVLLIFAGCQTEPLSSESGLTSADAKFNNQKTGPSFSNCEATSSPVDLYAGQNILVGNVEVVVNGDNYEITYNITNPDYCLTQTHLSVVNDQSEFPVNNSGNPQIGHFEYSRSYDCETTDTYIVPVADGPYIAAHAVVTCSEEGATENLYASLTGSINFCITSGRNIDGALSYMRVDVAEGSLAGSYWGWCADEVKNFNNVGVPNGDALCFNDDSFSIHSISEDTYISSIITNTDNLDNAIWLINNANTLLSEGYLYGNIQWALWKILNNQECNSCNYNLKLPSGDITIAGMEIYNRAMTDGEGFVPGCGDSTIAILDDGVSQPIIIPIPVPCGGDCDETAWADGCDFPGNQWATYFNIGE